MVGPSSHARPSLLQQYGFLYATHNATHNFYEQPNISVIQNANVLKTEWVHSNDIHVTIYRLQV